MNWISRVLQPLTSAAPRQPTPSEAFAFFAQWQQHKQDHHAQVRDRYLQTIAMQDWPNPTYPAHCVTCDAARALPVTWHGTDQKANVREGLTCPECSLNARQRAAYGLLRDRVGSEARVYATEQATPAYVWLRKRYRHARGSEYGVAADKAATLSRWLTNFGVHETIAHQDVTALTFADASLEAIVSFDVLEHVPDYAKALREFARVLAPGGLLVVTVPFIESYEQTSVRARIGDDGNIEHLLPPEIHGDPVSGGVLCFYHFGWDLLAVARDAGFAKAEWHRTWAPEQGVFGMWTLLAEK